ncbi:hypothetical protein BKA70DRAFT_1293152, partial [Coprinopsis sp. MPI-PUGE-AT-0042]
RVMEPQNRSKRRAAHEGASVKREHDATSLVRHHRCLDIPELVDHICEYVSDMGWGVKNPTLLALALTCKSLHPFAIKNLWRHLDGMGAIASVLSKGAWEYHGTTLYPSYGFERDVEPTLARIRQYTRHVRSISCPGPSWDSGRRVIKEYSFHYSALQAIHQHPLLPRPLFPSVQDVWMFAFHECPMASIFTPALLLSPSVRNLTVVTDSVYSDEDVRLSIPPDEVTGQEWVSVANRVADIAPQLSSFTIVMEQPQEQDVINRWAGKVPALSEVFERFSPSSLFTLDITPVVATPSTLTSIGRLKSLQTLQLSLFDFQYDEVNDLHPLHLPTLENLSLDTNSLSTCSAFAQTLHVNGLKSLTLSCFFDIDTDPAPFFVALQASDGYHTTPERIQVGRVHTGRIRDKPIWDELDEPRFIITPVTARSFLPFKHLESLSIGPCNPLELADHDLQTMLGSWPRLKVLKLDDETLTVDYQAPLLTLSGVHGALQSVPLLEKLTLSFDGSTFTPVSDSLTFSHQKLATWNVCSSSITLPVTFASWFAAQYPSLVTIEYFKMYLEGLRRAHAAWPFEEADVVLQAKAFINQFTETAVMVDRWASVRGCLLAKE